MVKVRAVIILLVGFLIAPFFLGPGATADDRPSGNGQTQVVNDEGYGNADTEYLNSEDDLINDEGISGSQENAYAK